MAREIKNLRAGAKKFWFHFFRVTVPLFAILWFAKRRESKNFDVY
ncbi:DUF1661 domain-containing protein [Porphyromonas gulae]|nr:DUF1661 domain-containing protein [Porphyromonas gulae]